MQRRAVAYPHGFAILMILLSSAASTCGGDKPGRSPAADCASAARSYCGGLLRCMPGILYRWYGTEPDCVRFDSASCEDFPRGIKDPARAGALKQNWIACNVAFEKASCDAIRSEEVYNTCGTPITNPSPVANGAACESGSDCQSGVCDWSGDSQCYRCQRGAEGDPCQVACGNGLRCAEQVCRREAKRGDRCIDGQCAGQLVCAGGVCSAGAATGARCASDFDCESQSCLADICAPPKPLPAGGPCSEDMGCKPAIQMCMNGTCVLGKSPGSSCTSDIECTTGACSAERTCDYVLQSCPL